MRKRRSCLRDTAAPVGHRSGGSQAWPRLQLRSAASSSPAVGGNLGAGHTQGEHVELTVGSGRKGASSAGRRRAAGAQPAGWEAELELELG